MIQIFQISRKSTNEGICGSFTYRVHTISSSNDSTTSKRPGQHASNTKESSISLFVTSQESE